MHPLHFPIIADENIHDEVVYFLRNQGLNIESIKELGLRGSTDIQIIALAEAEGKVILTHDADFGTMMYLSAQRKAGITFLRPGHINYSFTIQTLQALLKTGLNAEVPFMLVAERSGEDIKIRLRIL